MITASPSSAFTASESNSCGASSASKKDCGNTVNASRKQNRTQLDSDGHTCVKCGTDKRLTLYGFAKTPICRPCHKVLQDALIYSTFKLASDSGTSRSATPAPYLPSVDTTLLPVLSPSSPSAATISTILEDPPSTSQNPATPHPTSNLHLPIKRPLRSSTTHAFTDASSSKRYKTSLTLLPAAEAMPTPNLTPDASPSRGCGGRCNEANARIPHETCVRCGQHGLTGARRLCSGGLQCARCDSEADAASTHTDLTEDEATNEDGTVASDAEDAKRMEVAPTGRRRSGRFHGALAEVVELPRVIGRRRVQGARFATAADAVRDGDGDETKAALDTVSCRGKSSAGGSLVGMVNVLAAAAAALSAVGDDANAAVEKMVLDASPKVEGFVPVTEGGEGVDEAAFILAGLGSSRS
ncbi:hypothetical protein BC830DRAFT_1174374 [Chytriomyces sp. MP71]|nr:hypothetical protein BC830DRAFT_1174374 [Chytriomyces sp. MP71]